MKRTLSCGRQDHTRLEIGTDQINFINFRIRPDFRLIWPYLIFFRRDLIWFFYRSDLLNWSDQTDLIRSGWSEKFEICFLKVQTNQMRSVQIRSCEGLDLIDFRSDQKNSNQKFGSVEKNQIQFQIRSEMDFSGSDEPCSRSVPNRTQNSSVQTIWMLSIRNT